jgi:hypothetical protein
MLTVLERVEGRRAQVVNVAYSYAVIRAAAEAAKAQGSRTADDKAAEAVQQVACGQQVVSRDDHRW